MPIYEFRCTKCNAYTEVFQKLSDKQPTRCRKCKGRLEKLVSKSAISFKGEGWYVTDYPSEARKKAKEAEKPAGNGSDKGSGKASDKGAADKSTADKPAASKSDASPSSGSASTSSGTTGAASPSAPAKND